MPTPLRLLIVDDSEEDAMLLERELTKNGYELDCLRVDTLEAMQSALATNNWDVVISDFVMPDFSGMDALRILKERGIDIPFIIESRGIGEERIVEIIKAGADNYILKENLTQLAPTVEREIADAEVRRKCRHAKEDIEMHNEQLLLEQHELEAELTRFRELYDLAPVGYLTLSEDGEILEANQAAATMLGVVQSALVKQSIFRFIAKEDRDTYLLQRTKRFGSYAPQAWEMCLLRSNGSSFWAHVQATPAKDSEYWITITDISEHKNAEEYAETGREISKILLEPLALQESLQHVLTVLKTRTGFDAVGIRLQDGDDFPFFVQEGFPDDFLLTENSLIERAADGAVCRDKDGTIHLECACGLVISGKTNPVNPLFTKGGSCWTNDSSTLLAMPPDRNPRTHPRSQCIHQGYTSVALVPIRNNGNIFGLIHLNDRRGARLSLETVELLEKIAALIGVALMRKRFEAENSALEQQLQQSRKLESLGVLSGGIAHDFNNILAIILGNCNLARRSSDAVERCLTTIEKAVERAALLCRQMLAYAGKAPFEQGLVKMTTLVSEMAEIFKSSIPRNVQLKLDCPTDIPLITGDVSQLNQMVMNLFLNALEAIGNAQGEIRISLAITKIKDVTTDKDHLGKSIMPGRYVCLEVTDTGCGMDEECMQRIFEPFYTTKFSGRGLGMSETLGFIKAHKGALQLSSHLGQGTTFKVYLPAHIDESAKDEFFQQAAPVAWTGSGTILLVEDEEIIRCMASAMLEELGFTVIEAANGKEALELFQKNAADITLIVTDIGMPQMDGYELVHELKKLKEKLPIIVSSGFGDSVVTSRMPLGVFAALLNKPYRFEKLRDAVKGVLEGNSPVK